MLTLPAQISDAERAVNHHKHKLLVKVMAHIVRRALVQAYVSAGVASTAWNALRAREIIKAVPMKLSDEERGIFGGRIQNKNSDAKGRWVTAYRLNSRAAAVTWANNNEISLAAAELAPTTPPVQIELTIG